MSALPRTYARALRIAGWIVLALVLALCIGLPVGMALAAIWPTHADVGPAPGGFRDVELDSSDGLRLAGWYAPTRNGAAVILVHGAGGSRGSVKPLATALAEHGYGVLALDLAGHGESEGTTNRLGWRGTTDIQSAIDFLESQDESLTIGGVGISMGGEVLLGASAECPELRAIVADGATRRSTQELLALPSERPLVRNFTARVFYGAVRVLTGEHPPAPLLDELLQAPGTPVMLVAAGDDDLEVAFNEHFADTLGDRARLWEVPGVGHTGARARYTQEYDRRLLGFLDEHLLQ